MRFNLINRWALGGLIVALLQVGGAMAAGRLDGMTEPFDGGGISGASALPVLKVNVTQQGFNPRIPWQKLSPINGSGVGVVVADNKVLVTASMVQNARYLEFEKPRTGQRVSAKVLAVDYEANLALLEQSGESPNFMADLTALPLNTKVVEGDALEVWQLGRTGELLTAPIVVNKALVGRYLMPSSHFLTLEAYGILRAETNSITLPVVKGGKLAGLLLRYDARNQSLSLIPAAMIQQFLVNALKGRDTGFPSVGLVAYPTLDPQFREYLGLSNEHGGIYVGAVTPGGSGHALGIEVADILLSVNGKKIDNRGDVVHPLYGAIHYSHLLRGQQAVGDTVSAEVLRNGRILSLTGQLSRKESDQSIVPFFSPETGPRYIVYGGLILQELTGTYLQSFGEDWVTNAPQQLVQMATDPDTYEKQGLRRIVVLSGVIPVSGTQGYQELAGLRVTHVNGQRVKDLTDVQVALTQGRAELQQFEFDEAPHAIYLDAIQAEVDNRLLQGSSYRIAQLSRMQ